jgi:hypothetical protein
MQKFIYLLIGFCAFVSAKAQDTTSSDNAIAKPIQLSQVILTNGYASNHVTGAMALGLGLNASLDNGDIENSTNLLFGRNRTGLQSGIQIIFSKADRDYSLKFSRSLGASYSGDLFNLLFKGNAEFAGETMGLKLRARQFEMLSADFQIGNWGTKILSNKTALKLKQSVGFHALTKYTDARTFSENTFYTSPSGLELQADLDYRYENGNNFGFKGMGLGWSGYAYKQEKWEIDVFSISNLGFAYVLPGNVAYSKDSSWSYTGFNFGLRNGFSFDNTADSINGLLFDEETTEGKIIMLPVELEWKHQSKKWNYGAYYIALPGFLPRIHLEKKIFTKKLNSYHVGLQAGGWGLVNTKIQYTRFLKKEGNKLQMEIVGLESFFLPYSTFNLQLNYKL